MCINIIFIITRGKKRIAKTIIRCFGDQRTISVNFKILRCNTGLCGPAETNNGIGRRECYGNTGRFQALRSRYCNIITRNRPGFNVFIKNRTNTELIFNFRINRKGRLLFCNIGNYIIIQIDIPAFRWLATSCLVPGYCQIKAIKSILNIIR